MSALRVHHRPLRILLLIGTLTLLRLLNGSQEDVAYVIGMNRLRAAYANLDPGIDRYFIRVAP